MTGLLVFSSDKYYMSLKIKKMTRFICNLFNSRCIMNTSRFTHNLITKITYKTHMQIESVIGMEHNNDIYAHIKFFHNTYVQTS
jgi:phosphotransferase system IIB component